MSFLTTLFSFRGRINRVDFWISALWVAALWCAVVFARMIPVAVVGGLLEVGLLVAGLVVWFAAATRRLHDRDKSAWYVLIFFGVPSALQTMFAPHEPGYTMLYLFSGGTGSFLDLICLAIGIWMIVELGFLRGTAGPNQYGPDSSAASEVHTA